MGDGYFYLHQLSPFLWEISDGVGIRWYGLSYVLAFLGGQRIYQWLSEQRLNPISPGAVQDFITWGAVFGVLLGGRLGYMLLYDFSRLIESPASAIRVWEGGMASHGGILGLVLYTLYYSRRHGVSWTGIGDSLVVSAPLGLFLVRMANFINGELYGRASSAPWAVQFPAELRDRPGLLQGTPLAATPIETVLDVWRKGLESGQVYEPVLREVLTPRHPSQIYEGFLEGVLLFFVLWVMRTRMRVPRGVLTGSFFLLYGVLRIVGEQFREPDDFNFGMPRGVFLSLFLLLIGVVFLVWGLGSPEFEDGLSRRPRH
jgi:phosphatidylglycerol:prolipoprotein diacylglycerol transferase